MTISFSCDRPESIFANQSFEFKGLYVRSNNNTPIPALKDTETLQTPSSGSTLTKILGRTTTLCPVVIPESMIEQQFTFEKGTKRMLEIALG